MDEPGAVACCTGYSMNKQSRMNERVSGRPYAVACCSPRAFILIAESLRSEKVTEAFRRKFGANGEDIIIMMTHDDGGWRVWRGEGGRWGSYSHDDRAQNRSRKVVRIVVGLTHFSPRIQSITPRPTTYSSYGSRLFPRPPKRKKKK